MTDDVLQLDLPEGASASTLIWSLRGWMDGGEVSTGVADWVIDHTSAVEVGQIDPEPFTVRAMPGPLEFSGPSRPRVRIEDGRIESLAVPQHRILLSTQRRLAVLLADEPHIQWALYRKVFFDLVARLGAKQVIFVGGVNGALPHTREPRLHFTASSNSMLDRLTAMGLDPVSYQGPASFATYCLSVAKEQGVDMAMIVAEVPAYFQGRNPKAMLSALRKLSAFGLIDDFPTDTLRTACDHWERRVTEAAAEHDDLLSHINKLEEDYDNDLFDTQMGDLKDWLEEKGLRID